MKWLKIVLTILEWVLPGLAKKGKDNLVKELEIAGKTIQILSKDLSADEKGRVIEDALSSLSAVKNLKKRTLKKFEKAKDRFWKKVF